MDTRLEEDKQVRTPDDFSYKERNLIDDLNRALREAFKGTQLFPEDVGASHVATATMATAYGEAFVASSKGTRERGRNGSLVYSLTVEVEWYARTMVGESTAGSATGKIVLGDVSYDNAEPKAWTCAVKLLAESNASMNQQTAPEPSRIQQELKDLVGLHGTLVAKSTLSNALAKFAAEEGADGVANLSNGVSSLALGSLSQIKEESKEKSTTEGANVISIDDPKIAAEIKILRRQLLGKSYQDIVFNNLYSEYGTTWKFMLCSIRDDDVLPLVEALAANGSEIQELSLDYNEVGDKGMKYLGDALKSCPALRRLSLRRNIFNVAGLQTLAASLCMGACVDLQELDLRENPGVQDETCAAVLQGLELMRPQIKVVMS